MAGHHMFLSNPQSAMANLLSNAEFVDTFIQWTKNEAIGIICYFIFCVLLFVLFSQNCSNRLDFKDNIQRVLHHAHFIELRINKIIITIIILDNFFFLFRFAFFFISFNFVWLKEKCWEQVCKFSQTNKQKSQMRENISPTYVDVYQ